MFRVIFCFALRVLEREEWVAKRRRKRGIEMEGAGWVKERSRYRRSKSAVENKRRRGYDLEY